MTMKKVSDVMHSNPEFCTLATRVPDIKYLMKKYAYNEMTVVNTEHLPVGLISLNSLADEVLEDYLHPFDLKAEELMKPLAFVINTESPLDECLKIMEKNNLTMLPVVDQLGHYSGIIKKDDILKSA